MKFIKTELAVSVEHNGQTYVRLSDGSWYSERDMIKNVKDVRECELLDEVYNQLTKKNEKEDIIPFGAIVKIANFEDDIRNNLEGVVIGCEHNGEEAFKYTILVTSQVDMESGNIFSKKVFGYGGYPAVTVPARYVKFIGPYNLFAFI